MTLLQLVVLSAVQGITEFLPVSSSGHLVLVPAITGWPDQGLAIDVAVHVGTVFAVMLYFWRDLLAMALGLGALAKGRQDDGGQLALKVVLATLPVIIAGFFVNAFYADLFRSVTVIAWTTLGFGIVLYVADRTSLTIRRMDHVGYLGALFVGLFQVLALVPGTSRSGITMTAARLLGLERRDAARFSMLLSIPVITGAGTLKGIELYKSGNAQLTADAAIAAGLSFVVALAVIGLLMAWLRRASFTPFVIYRVLLGAVLLYLVYFMPGVFGGT